MPRGKGTYGSKRGRPPKPGNKEKDNEEEYTIKKRTSASPRRSGRRSK